MLFFLVSNVYNFLDDYDAIEPFTRSPNHPNVLLCYLVDDGATGKCAASCDGRPDGTYQSCDTCSKYITCASGTAVEMACPAEFHPFLAWDSDLNTCARGGLSQTCVEPRKLQLIPYICVKPRKSQLLSQTCREPYKSQLAPAPEEVTRPVANHVK